MAGKHLTESAANGTYGQTFHLSGRGLDATGATGIDAAFQAIVTSMTAKDVLVIDRGTWRFTAGNIAPGGKQINIEMAGGILTAPALSGVPLFLLGAGDKVTLTGRGRITGPGKATATLNTNAFTVNGAPGGLYLDGDIEIDGWYHGIRPNGTSTGLHVVGAYIHDNTFSAGFPHAGDKWDIRCKDNGTTLLHHDLYVSGNDGGCNGARASIRVRTTGCGGQAVQVWAEGVGANAVSGFDVEIHSDGCYGALAVGLYDTSGCTFKVHDKGSTDRGIQVLGNVYGCEFSGTVQSATGRNIDVANSAEGRPRSNKWNVVSTGGGDAANAATNMFAGTDSNELNIVAKDSGRDCVRLSGAHYNTGTLTVSGSVAGDGLRLSGASHDNTLILNSRGQFLYDLDITPNDCVNNTIRGRGASHADLAQNVNVAAGTLGLDLSGFINSFSSGVSGTVESARLWIPGGSLVATAGSAAQSYAPSSPSADRWQAWLLDATTEEGVGSSFLVPEWWQKIDVELWWTNVGAGSGDVRWQVLSKVAGDAEAMGTSTANAAVTATAPAQSVLKKTTVATGITVAAGKLTMLQLRRVAADAADTLANDAGVTGLLLKRAS